jgi:hypothetical protein
VIVSGFPAATGDLAHTSSSFPAFTGSLPVLPQRVVRPQMGARYVPEGGLEVNPSLAMDNLQPLLHALDVDWIRAIRKRTVALTCHRGSDACDHGAHPPVRAPDQLNAVDVLGPGSPGAKSAAGVLPVDLTLRRSP